MNKKELLTFSISVVHINIGLTFWATKQQKTVDETYPEKDVEDMPEEKPAKKKRAVKDETEIDWNAAKESHDDGFLKA